MCNEFKAPYFISLILQNCAPFVFFFIYSTATYIPYNPIQEFKAAIEDLGHRVQKILDIRQTQEPLISTFLRLTNIQNVPYSMSKIFNYCLEFLCGSRFDGMI